MKSIYLNQAGTTWPKPACVSAACTQALEQDVDTWDTSFQKQQSDVCDFLGIQDPNSLLLTPGCTSSLNVAVADHDWREGDVVITSALEHHALHRPLVKLTQLGVDLQVVPPDLDEPINLQRVEDLLRGGKVKMIAVTAASNVTGDLLPIDELAQLAHDHGASILIDGAQYVGWFDLNLSASPFDLFAFGGHKGLHGPWRIGGLYIDPELPMNAPQATCSIEAGPASCTSQPNYCDVGSADRIAMAGLSASLDWLRESDSASRLELARCRAGRLREVLAEVPGITFYGSSDPEKRLPIVAFTIRERSTTELGRILKEQGLVTSPGLQCAPMAHDILGSAPEGVVRLSVGPMNSDDDIEQSCECLAKLR
ncbi:MAG: aminotransferase class V-fold PLP-dependent enzyme [Planctomycetota bacterium]